MANYNSTATVDLVINGEDARKKMDDLTKQAKKLRAEADKAAAAGDKKTAQKKQKEVEKLEKQYKRLQDQISRTDNTLRHMDKASFSDLNAALRQAQNNLQGMARGSEAWNRQAELVRRLRSEISRCNDALRIGESRWQRMNRWINDSQTAIAGIIAGISMIIMAGRKAVNAYASMEQEMANVRKFTGMEAEDVEQLNEQLKKINTRTSREDLNKLAQEAGRLGKTSQEDVLGFVRAADKINVALDDLGEGATLTLSKLTGIFGDEKRLGTERALLSVGSVINELSQNCSASAPYIAEFASRMGGVGAQAGMTAQQIMAYAAVLDSNNQKLEASSTALSQVIVRIYQEPQKYAKVAGMDASRFAKLVKTDMNVALIEFLSTLSKAGKMDVLSPMFKDMGENGSRAISALSTLAGHISEVKEQQRVANEAFAEATSIDKEFDVQNNTVQAGLDKAKNKVNELAVALGQKLQPVMSMVISSSTIALKVISLVVDFLVANRKEIVMASFALATYAVTVNAVAIKTALMTAWTRTWAVLCKALPATMGLLNVAFAALKNSVLYFTNGLQVNYKMQMRWKKAVDLMMSANPAKVFTLAAVAAVALSKIIVKLISHYTNQRMALEEVQKIRNKAAASVEEEKTKIQQLMKAAADHNTEEKERIEICNRLNEIIPDFNAKIDSTTKAFRFSTDALNKHIQSLTRFYELQGARETLKTLGADRAKLKAEQTQIQQEIDAQNAQNSAYQASNAGQFQTTSGTSLPGFALTSIFNSGAMSALNMRLRGVNRKLAEKDAEMNAIYKAFGVMELLTEEGGGNQDAPEGTDGDGATGLGSGGYTSQTLADKERKQAEAAARRAAAKEKKEFRQRLESVKGEWEKEDAANTARYRSGEGTYLGFLERKHDLEIKYLDDSMKVYADANLQEDEDYAALLKKKEERLMKWNERKKALEASEAQRRQRYEEMEANTDFLTPASPLFGNEEVLQMRLYDIKIKYLKKAQAAQQRDSEEYHNYEVKIQESEQEEKMRRQKRFMEVVQRYSVDFQRKSAEERLAIERECLEQALRLGMITQEQFEKSIKALRDSMLPESQKEPEDKSKSKKHYSNDPSYKSELQNLESLHAAKLISEEEFLKRKAKLNREYERKMVDSLGSEYFSMIYRVYDTTREFVANLKDATPADILSNLADIMAASWAVAQAAIQSYSEHSQACAELEVAQAEKKYERITAFAEGNAYKTKQAEKQKEKEIARIKSEQSRKQFAMNVLTAVAQTAINAVAAYGAGLQVGGPAGLVLAPIAAAMAMAAGAIQIATLKKQQQAAEATGYMQGGFTPPGRRDKAVGVVHAGEWVAPQELVNNPRTRPMIEFLESARRGNRIGSITHADVSRTVTAPIITAQSSRSAAATAVQRRDPAENSPDTRLGDTLDRLEQRLSKPFVTVNTVTGDHGIRKAEEEYDRLMRNKSK